MKQSFFQAGGLLNSDLSLFATPAGQAAMLESNQNNKQNAPKNAEKPSEKNSDALLEAVGKKAQQDSRGVAAAAVIEWAQNGDGSFDSFDELAIGLAGIDTENEDDLTDDQVDDYNKWLSLMADAAVSLGANQADVTEMIDGADDDAASTVIDDIDTEDDDEAVAEFSVTGDDDGAMMEANVKVVRNGVVKLIKKRPRPRRMSSAQKSALKKARMKAHSASAKTARKKSMKLRSKRGM
ncbi:MAG: hypothetical protein ACRC6N_11095 [Plesiomonas sp.]|uniref:hypothetical protein n=1 Tax=Plesiomonas sp. TaxID=2486279 RepID=UPI003F32692A